MTQYFNKIKLFLNHKFRFNDLNTKRAMYIFLSKFKILKYIPLPRQSVSIFKNACKFKHNLIPVVNQKSNLRNKFSAFAIFTVGYLLINKQKVNCNTNRNEIEKCMKNNAIVEF